jgi:hypothetical protein
MCSEPFESEIVYWKISEGDDQQVRQLLRDLRKESNLTVFEDRHDLQEFQEYYQITESHRSVERLSEEIADVSKQIQETFDFLREAEVRFVEIMYGTENEPVSEDVEEISKTVEINRNQSEEVDELFSLLEKRQELIEKQKKIVKDLDERKDISHETYAEALSQNAELIAVSLESGYIILNTWFILSQMEAKRKSVEKLQSIKQRVSKSTDLGEVKDETDDDLPEDVKEKIDEIHEKIQSKE